MPLITTNEFTPLEVKEIAAKALEEYKTAVFDGSRQASGESVENGFCSAATNLEIHQKLSFISGVILPGGFDSAYGDLSCCHLLN